MLSNTLIYNKEKCLSLAKKIVEENYYLSLQEAEELFEYFMCDFSSSYQVSSVLSVMRHRGENIDEIMGLYKVIRRRMNQVELNVEEAIDIGGTGGGKPTLNISTTAALITAASGAHVCKHGNYRVSSASGSFDLLTSLGLNIDLCTSPKFAKNLYERFGITFLSTRSYHKHPPSLIQVRKKLGFSTAFNMIGPLLNPAGVKYQVIGVSDPFYMELAARILIEEGRRGFVMVYGQEGIDEVSPCGPTSILEYRDGNLKSYVLTPKDFGLDPVEPSLVKGGTSKENAHLITKILTGESPERLEVVLPTVALALYTCNAVSNLIDGVALAKETVKNGRAARLLSDLQAVIA